MSDAPSSSAAPAAAAPTAQVAATPASVTNDPEPVALEDDQGTFRVPVLINNTITLKFTIDSGASVVNIPADVALTLYRAGTISADDFVGNATFRLADGTMVPSPMFRIRSLKVGNLELHNVVASVSDRNGSLLLGQSFLSRLSSWSIDNGRHVLLFNASPGAALAPLALDDPSPTEVPSSSSADEAKAAPEPSVDTSQAAAAARDRTLAYYAAWSGQDAQSIADARPYYASSVRFYGRQLDVDQLMAAVMTFGEHWPVRHYTVREPLKVSCQDEHTCLVQGVSDWDAPTPRAAAT
jgi:clan AA aspartic protease (TIGR02281 family)